MVFLAAAVGAQHPREVGHLVVVGDEQAAVTERAEVLAGEEGVRADVTDGAGLLAFVAGAEGLGAVFDDQQVVFLGDGHDFVHGAGVAVQVDGHDGAGAGRDLFADAFRVDVVRVWVDVREDGCGADGADAFGGGEEGEGCGDDLVAGADVQGSQADDQGVGAAVHADGVFHAEVIGDFLFEREDVWPHDELPGTHDALHGGVQFVPQFVDFGGEVEDGNAGGVGGHWSLLISVSLIFW